MLKVIVDYPTIEEEKRILERMTSPQKTTITPVTSASHIITASSIVESIYIDERVQNYIVNIVYATRRPENYGLPKLKECIARGASPRATIALAAAAKALAFMDMRAFVTPDDIQKLAYDVLQHRIALTYEAEADNITPADIIEAILGKVEVP